MSAALCALHEVIARDARTYKNLIPSFVSILKQVSQQQIGYCGRVLCHMLPAMRPVVSCPVSYLLTAALCISNWPAL